MIDSNDIYVNDSIVDYMTHPNLIILLIFVNMILMAAAKRTFPFIAFCGLLLLCWIGFVYDYAFSMQGILHKMLSNLMINLYKIFPWMIWAFFVYGVYSNVINLFMRNKV
jgi:hypothetical protein